MVHPFLFEIVVAGVDFQIENLPGYVKRQDRRCGLAVILCLVYLSRVPVKLFRWDTHLLYPLSCKHHSPHSDSWRPHPSYKLPGR